MNDERPPDRATWFKFYGQRYLIGGSLRWETEPDERSVWTDVMCLANAGGGQFDCSNRDALAIQLNITRELFDRATDKFIKAKRLSVRFDEEERKEIFTLVKWDYYQAPPRSHKKAEDAEVEDQASSPAPPLSERKKDKIDRKKEGRISESSFSEKGRKNEAESPPVPRTESESERAHRLNVAAFPELLGTKDMDK